MGGCWKQVIQAARVNHPLLTLGRRGPWSMTTALDAPLVRHALKRGFSQAGPASQWVGGLVLS